MSFISYFNLHWEYGINNELHKECLFKTVTSKMESYFMADDTVYKYVMKTPSVWNCKFVINYTIQYQCRV